MFNFFRKKLPSENIYSRIAAAYLLLAAIFSPSYRVQLFFSFLKAYFAAIIPLKAGRHLMSCTEAGFGK